MGADELTTAVKAWLAEYDRRGAAEVQLTAEVAARENDIQAMEIIDTARRATIADLQAQLAALQHPLPQPEPVPTPPQRRKLTYPPPVLVDPITITIDQPGTLKLNPEKDYILKLKGVMRGYLPIVGGRNWTLIGGEFDIPHQGEKPSITSRTALKVVGCTGVAHIEGIWMHGVDFSEGIQIDAPLATVQIQNVRGDALHHRSDPGWTDPQHSDMIQPYGGCKRLLVDGLTWSSGYQGLFLAATLKDVPPMGEVELRHVNGVQLEGGRYQVWLQDTPGAGAVTLDEVYVQVHPGRAGGLGKSVWPDIDSGKLLVQVHEATGQQRASWHGTHLKVTGRVYEGMPDGGDFVPVRTDGSPGQVGVEYVSPGYVSE